MKKHNEINYHTVRKATAAGILLVGNEDGTTNLADVHIDESFDRRETMEYLLEHHTAGMIVYNVSYAKVQPPETYVHEVYLPSRLSSMA
jgi:tmRNA-binding protein